MLISIFLVGIETLLNYLSNNVSIFVVLFMDDCLETSKVFGFLLIRSTTIRVVELFFACYFEWIF